MTIPLRVVHSIVCCRVILNLRRAALPRDTPPSMSISLTFEAAPGERTYGAETIQLDAYGERSDGRDSRQQASQSSVAGYDS